LLCDPTLEQSIHEVVSLLKVANGKQRTAGAAIIT
jgi:hypothetical protein